MLFPISREDSNPARPYTNPAEREVLKMAQLLINYALNYAKNQRNGNY